MSPTSPDATSSPSKDTKPPIPSPGVYVPPGRRAAAAAASPAWVDPPANPDRLYRGEEGLWITSRWNEQLSTPERIQSFLTRWPPSRTPTSHCAWISADRGGRRGHAGDIDGLRAAFSGLVASDTITVAALDRIAQEHDILVGKWLLHADSQEIDELWGKVVRMLCLERKRGSAKVSTNNGDNHHVICVYVDDYMSDDVTSLRKVLRGIGVKGKIGFKTDAYTYLGIYASNPWRIRPTRYQE